MKSSSIILSIDLAAFEKLLTAIKKPLAAVGATAGLLVLASCAMPPAGEIKTAAPTILAATAPDPQSLRRDGPPIAPVRTVTETFFGQTASDPYRYMEDAKSPEMLTYLHAQSDYASTVLDAIPGRQAMQNRINSLSEAGVQISGVQITGVAATPRVFYYKLMPGETTKKLYTRNGFKGAEQLLFDPQAISKPGERYALDFYTASPDGRHVIVGMAAGGSEETLIRVVEVAAARDMGMMIDHIGFADSTAWAPDSRSFFYNRLPITKAGEVKNRYLRSQAWHHVLGRSLDKDELVLAQGMPGVTLADVDIPAVAPTADGKYLIGKIEHGDAREISLYVAEASAQGLPVGGWRKAVEPKDEVTDYASYSNGLYLLTHKNAPRYKVVRTSLSRPDLATATTIVAHGDTVISELKVAQDALYIRELNGGVDRLQRLNFSNSVFSGGKLEFVRLPFDLAIRQLITDPKRPGAILRLEGWTEAPRYVSVEERTANIADTGLQPKPSVDFSAIDEVRLMVTAKDGVKVPISLIYKKGTTLNANNPTLLRAYGAYGFTQVPSFSPASMAWLERGGIIGTCHVRGGGEFGEEWHRGGQKLTKPNSWRDLIACAEYMVERRFTRKEKMAIQGGSAGGITVGRALTERPDLFAAVVPTVGVLDALRMEFTPNGPPNIPEFGSVKTAEGFKGLWAMSSFHQVQDGANYPAVLLMHGVNDPRVEVWHSAKMAARLQAAVANNRNSKPVLLRLDYDAGHGVGSTRSQRNAELADVYSFLLWQFGVTEFQPK